MPEAARTHTTRRDLLKATPGAFALPALAAFPSGHPDDELFALCGRIVACRRRWILALEAAGEVSQRLLDHGIGAFEHEMHPDYCAADAAQWALGDEHWSLCGALLALPACTLAGVLAKIDTNAEDGREADEILAAVTTDLRLLVREC